MPEQRDRFFDMARRLARTWRKRRTKITGKWIEEAVDNFISGLDEDWLVRVRDWDHTDPVDDEPCIGYMCDVFAEWKTDYIYYSVCDLATEKERRRLEKLREYGPHNVEEDLKNRIVDRWALPVACCVRAALDCAAGPSAGVFGFTAGDLRRAYPDGVPEWIAGVVSTSTGTFNELPDAAPVWM